MVMAQTCTLGISCPGLRCPHDSRDTVPAFCSADCNYMFRRSFSVLSCQSVLKEEKVWLFSTRRSSGSHSLHSDPVGQTVTGWLWTATRKAGSKSLYSVYHVLNQKLRFCYYKRKKDGVSFLLLYQIAEITIYKKGRFSWASWHMPIIPATLEAEAGGSQPAWVVQRDCVSN